MGFWKLKIKFGNWNFKEIFKWNFKQTNKQINK